MKIVLGISFANRGSAAQIFPKALHKKFWRTEKVPLFPHGESSGEIWVQNPHFAYGFLWPGWFGAQIYWGSSGGWYSNCL